MLYYLRLVIIQWIFLDMYRMLPLNFKIFFLRYTTHKTYKTIAIIIKIMYNYDRLEINAKYYFIDLSTYYSILSLICVFLLSNF